MSTATSTATSLPGADQAADGEHERLVCLASWAASLAEHDPTWRSLHDEKQHGWASAALDWWWRENDKQYARQDRNDKVGGTPGTAKYVRFYSQWLPRVAPQLFGREVCLRGLEPSHSRQGPRQACYSHVRASPWTGTSGPHLRRPRCEPGRPM